MCICSFSTFFLHLQVAASDYYISLPIILAIFRKKNNDLNINFFPMATKFNITNYINSALLIVLRTNH